MKNLLIALILIALGVMARVVPHPANFAPVGAIALFGGAVFGSRRAAMLVPLAAMFAGDTILELTTGYGYHALMPAVYGSYALIAVLGMLIRHRRRSPVVVGAASLASSTIFFLVTNLAMWTISEVFPRTFEGLGACYLAGIPYFGRTMLSDLIFAAVFFGVHAFASDLTVAREGKRA
jgi:hypothetical protein